MNEKKTGALSITVKFTSENSPSVLAAAQAAGLPLATWARGVLERDAGLSSEPEADMTPLRPEPMTGDELTRRQAVRLLGEAVHTLREREKTPEAVIVELKAAAASVVATLPRRAA